MPLYVYENELTGETIELVRPVECRDQIHLAGFRRVTAPQRVSVSIPGNPEDSLGQRAAVLDGFKAIEQKPGGLDEIRRETGMTVDQIKRAWAAVLAFLLVLGSAVAGDLTPGKTFTDGQRVTASDLNTHVSGAVLAPAAISGKTATATSTGSDQMLIYRSGYLFRGTLADLLFNSTNWVPARPEITTPDTNDYFLVYHSTNSTLHKVTVENALFANTNLIGSRPAVTNFAKTDLAILSVGGVNVSLTTSNLAYVLATLVPGVSNVLALSRQDYEWSTGDIKASAIAHGASPPTGWLICDGAAVSRTTYSNLFTAIGTTWGIGDNSTTFNVPDLRGRTAVGAGTGTGLTARSTGTLFGNEAHTNTVAEAAGVTAVSITANGLDGGAYSLNTVNSVTTGVATPFNQQPPSSVVTYLVKY
jgi:microcystin-dependent protein